MDLIILFVYHNKDKINWDHYNLMKAHNKDALIIPLTDGNANYLPGTVDVSKCPIEIDVSRQWFNVDTILYRWFRNTNVFAKKYVVAEYDVLCEVPFQTFMADVWDAPMACKYTFTYGDHPDWNWFVQTVPLAPPEYKNHLAAAGQFALMMFKHETLKNICSLKIPDRMHAEMRIGTLANKVGVTPSVFPKSGSIDYSYMMIDQQPYPTIYHPVKCPLPFLKIYS